MPPLATTGESPEQLAQILLCLLGMDRQPVGIALLPDQAAFDHCPLPQIRHKVSYCTMVMLASRKNRGKGRKATAVNFACPGAAHVFGFIPTDNHMASGQKFMDFGLYDRLETAARTQAEMCRLKTPPHGVAVAPLQSWQASPPDTVLLILNAYQAMRLVQAHAHKNGVLGSFTMVGNRGICSECTAVPLTENRINLSLLCSNTRFSAQWKDEELGLGLPYADLPELVRGLMATLNPCETDRRKSAIGGRCTAAGLDLPITFHSSYFKH